MLSRPPLHALLLAICFLLSVVAVRGGSCLGASGPTSSGESSQAAQGTESSPLTFERDVRPIFKAMCFHCHGEEPELQGGLDVRLVHLMSKGGDSGVALAAGNSAESLLWQKIESDEMPVGAHKLTDEQKSTIKSWIDSGANTARAEPRDPNDARFTDEELSFWAFQPPLKPQVPAMSSMAKDSPIVAFIYRDLAAKGLDFSAEADKATLLRRVKVDLHGILPTTEELTAFQNDIRPDAYERLIDQLLESPQYGVRWGRHWLDAAGFAESDGNTGTDQVRDHAWRYRDYVIDSLNADKPYDQFIREQLAGDELISGEPDPENPEHVSLIIATGFLRMAPDVTATENSINDRNQAVADAMKVVSSSILGLSVGCAQCHDHRYDPISIDDYYRFRAIFDPALSIHAWKQPSQRLIDLTTPEVRKARDEMEAIAVERDQDIERRRREVAQKIFDLRIAEVPEELRPQLTEAIQTPIGKQTDEQKKWLVE